MKNETSVTKREIKNIGKYLPTICIYIYINVMFFMISHFVTVFHFSLHNYLRFYESITETGAIKAIA